MVSVTTILGFIAANFLYIWVVFFGTLLLSLALNHWYDKVLDAQIERWQQERIKNMASRIDHTRPRVRPKNAPAGFYDFNDRTQTIQTTSLIVAAQPTYESKIGEVQTRRKPVQNSFDSPRPQYPNNEYSTYVTRLGYGLSAPRQYPLLEHRLPGPVYCPSGFDPNAWANHPHFLDAPLPGYIHGPFGVVGPSVPVNSGYQCQQPAYQPVTEHTASSFVAPSASSAPVFIAPQYQYQNTAAISPAGSAAEVFSAAFAAPAAQELPKPLPSGTISIKGFVALQDAARLAARAPPVVAPKAPSAESIFKSATKSVPKGVLFGRTFFTPAQAPSAAAILFAPKALAPAAKGLIKGEDIQNYQALFAAAQNAPSSTIIPILNSGPPPDISKFGPPAPASRPIFSVPEHAVGQMYSARPKVRTLTFDMGAWQEAEKAKNAKIAAKAKIAAQDAPPTTSTLPPIPAAGPPPDMSQYGAPSAAKRAPPPAPPGGHSLNSLAAVFATAKGHPAPAYSTPAPSAPFLAPAPLIPAPAPPGQVPISGQRFTAGTGLGPGQGKFLSTGNNKNRRLN